MAGTPSNKLLGPCAKRVAAVVFAKWAGIMLLLFLFVLTTGEPWQPFWPQPVSTAGPGPAEWFALQHDLVPGEVARLSAPPFSPRPPAGPGAGPGAWLIQAGRTDRPYSVLRGSWTIFSTMRWLGDFTATEWDRPPSELSSLAVAGDWTFRSDAPRTARLKAGEEILRKHLGRQIVIENRTVRRQVKVARDPGGGYRHKKLDPKWPADEIQVLADKSQYVARGPNYGYLKTFHAAIEELTQVRVVDETVFAGIHVSWINHFTPAEHPNVRNRPATIDAIFANLAEQTSLRYERDVRDVEVWSVREGTP